MGDTLRYTIEVTWEESRIPVLVLAPDSVDFTGLKCVDQSTRHEKDASSGKVENRALFTYDLIPTQVGPAKAASLKVRYTTGLSGREEAVFAPSAHIEILPARFGFVASTWFRTLVGSLLACLLGLGIFQAVKKAKRSRKASQSDSAAARREGLVKDVLALRGRIGNGESRTILNEMERLCLSHLRVTLKSADTTTKFDALLNSWLGNHPDDLERTADWERLRELFRQARYAGGHKEPHELQDAWRAMKRCLEVADEN